MKCPVSDRFASTNGFVEFDPDSSMIGASALDGSGICGGIERFTDILLKKSGQKAVDYSWRL